MSNIEYRAVIKFFIWKGLNATETSKELDSVYKNDAPSSSGFAEVKGLERAFEDSFRMGCPSAITTDQNIQAVERIGMRDLQISARHLAYVQQRQFMRSSVIFWA